jgi:hypothetical protein
MTKPLTTSLPNLLQRRDGAVQRPPVKLQLAGLALGKLLGVQTVEGWGVTHEQGLSDRLLGESHLCHVHFRHQEVGYDLDQHVRTLDCSAEEWDQHCGIL